MSNSKISLSVAIFLVIATCSVSAMDIIVSDNLVSFEGRENNFASCWTGTLSVRTFLKDGLFGYLPIQSDSVFGRDFQPDHRYGSMWYHNVTGNFTLNKYGKFSLVADNYYFCTGDSYWASNVFWPGDAVREYRFEIPDPILKGNWLHTQETTNGPITREIFTREFNLEEVVPLDLLLKYQANLECEINGHWVRKNSPEITMDKIDITQFLKTGKNKITCSASGSVNWYHCGYVGHGSCFHKSWCVANPRNHFLCSRPPTQFLQVDLRRGEGVKWLSNSGWLVSPLPLREDIPFREHPRFYREQGWNVYIEEGNSPFRGNQKVVYDFTILEPRELFLSSPTEPVCTLNNQPLKLSQNQDDYWIWYGGEISSGSHFLDCTILHSSEFLNMFDAILIDPTEFVQSIEEYPEVSVSWPFDYSSGRKNNSTIYVSQGNITTIPIGETTSPVDETAIAVGLTIAGASAFVIGKSIRPKFKPATSLSAYYLNSRKTKSAYNEQLANTEKLNKAFKAQSEKARLLTKIEVYKIKLGKARTLEERLAIIGDDEFPDILKILSTTWKEEITDYIDKKIDDTKQEIALLKEGASRVFGSPLDVLEYHGFVDNPRGKIGDFVGGLATGIVSRYKRKETEIDKDIALKNLGVPTVEYLENERRFGPHNNQTRKEYDEYSENRGRIGDKKHIMMERLGILSLEDKRNERRYGLNNNQTWEEYEADLLKESLLVSFDDKRIENEFLYNLGTYFVKEGIKCAHVSDGFSETAKLLMFPEVGLSGFFKKTVSMPVAIYSGIMSASFKGISIISKSLGNVMQNDSIEIGNDFRLKQKIESRRIENQLDTIVLGVGAYVGNIKNSTVKGFIEPVSIIFYKEFDKITEWFKSKVMVKDDEEKKE
jgi:hypothetical protein